MKKIEQAATQSENKQSENKGTLLIVDDAEDFIFPLQQFLTELGYQTDVALSGEDALGKAEQKAYEVILLDLVMPGIDGMECLQKLKENSCKAIVIMLTGHGTIPTAVQAVKLGAQEFIQKPFLAEDLVHKIRDAVRLKRRPTLDQDPVVAYVYKHAIQIRDREEVAAHFSISPDTVSSRVRQATDQAFREFLHICRLKIARNLLAETTLDIAAVAERAGFRTTSHFSRIFRYLEDMSPTQYRRKMRAKKAS
jgi:YesN/AraC family two-component response regulator